MIIGSRVLAHDGDGWYRSLVRNIDGDNVEVFILDLAALITVDASTLKVASPQLFELPIMAVPACLSGWEGEEDPAKIAEEWGEKMKELVLRCGAGGRDHLPCCARRGVPAPCQPLCQAVHQVSTGASFQACLPNIGQVTTLSYHKFIIPLSKPFRSSPATRRAPSASRPLSCE